MADQDVPPVQSSHRLPTVSASQALQSLHTRGARSVPTGLTQLDRLLAPPSLPGQQVAGGYARGKVTEVYGPSGVGKTSLLLQAAAHALHEGQRVYWIDAACAPLVPRRLHDMLAAHSDPPSESTSDQLRSRFHHLVAPTLAHALALFVHPPSSFPHSNTSLVVIDSLSTLIDNAYPRNTDDRLKNRTDQSKWAAGRRYAVINDLIATLTTFAALHDIALVITCQTITRIRGASRALLVPAISGVEWENGISARLLLFRDWVPQQAKAQDKVETDKLQKTRFAGLVKLNGVALADEGGVGNVVPFAIDSHGLCDINLTTDDTATTMVLPIQPRAPKRTFDEVDENVAEEPNSDEVYGWIEDDAVAAEGLLIDDVSTTIHVDARQEPTAEGRSAKGVILDVFCLNHCISSPTTLFARKHESRRAGCDRASSPIMCCRLPTVHPRIPVWGEHPRPQIDRPQLCSASNTTYLHRQYAHAILTSARLSASYYCQPIQP